MTFNPNPVGVFATLFLWGGGLNMPAPLKMHFFENFFSLIILVAKMMNFLLKKFFRKVAVSAPKMRWKNSIFCVLINWLIDCAKMEIFKRNFEHFLAIFEENVFYKSCWILPKEMICEKKIAKITRNGRKKGGGMLSPPPPHRNRVQTE